MTAAGVLLLATVSPVVASSAFDSSRRSPAFLAPPSATPRAAKRAETYSYDVISSKPLLATNNEQQPGKGDLYSDDELFDLLNLHLALNPEQQEKEQLLSGELNVASIPGIHDLVLDAIDDITTTSTTEQQPSINQLRFDNLQTILREKKPMITAIATDVDGTLLSAGQELHPITREAVLKAIDQSYNSSNANKIKHFFPATGKSRQGAMGSLGDAIGPLLYNCPGVYIQGLYCIDREGNVVFEKKLSPLVVKEAEQLVQECGISICGYDGDDLYTTEQTDVVRSLSEFYGEPTVQLVLGMDGSVITLSEHENGCHKLLIMDEDVEMLRTVVRPKLEKLAEKHGVIVTQALPTMLELLPGGCSKAVGVQKLCEALGIDAETELLALGDAENDAGMLEMASIGVAVGNACPVARSAADFIMTERNDEGGAGLAMEMFGFD
jgi:Cof subfamily protein (haloacid dehalogenase superfamily)